MNSPPPRTSVSHVPLGGLLAVLLVGAVVGCGGSGSEKSTAQKAENQPTDLNLNLDPVVSTRVKDDPNLDPFEDESRYFISRDKFLASDDPPVVEAEAADFLQNDDEVLGFVINGEARAYSIQALAYHHVVNDTLAGAHLAVTY